VALSVVPAAPAIFAADASGKGPGAIRNQDNSLNTAQNPAKAGSVIQIYGTGGGTVAGGATDGALATPGKQALPVTATVGGVAAPLLYAGPAPGEVNGILQVNVTLPSGLPSGAQPVIVTVGGAASQSGITVAVQ
jgi:uncharacterized protein (TIGR03437 family)